MPPAPAKMTKREIALREKWTLEKLTTDNQQKDEKIAKFAKAIIADYLYFQSRQRGGEEDLDEIHRLAAERQELIQESLALFMGLSAAGYNIDSRIDERIQR